MTPAPTAADWSPRAAEDRLGRLWAAYAAGIGRLGILAPAGSADRFRSEVLDPFEAPASTVRWGKVRAVAAWPDWRPDKLARTDQPTPDRLARLRDGLGALLTKIDHAEAPSGWFGKRPEPLADGSARKLLKQCRDALDALTRPLPPAAADALADLRTLANEVDTLLAAAPPTWPAAAPLRARELVELTSAEPDSGPLADAAKRLSEFTRRPDGDPAATAAAAAEALTAAVQNAGPLARLGRDRAEWLDRVLAALRGWGAGFGVEFLPRGWSFASPPPRSELGGAGTELAAVYRPDEPAGTVIRLKAFGVAAGGKVVRPASVSISAGPAPAGLGDLEALVKDLDHPSAEGIRSRLRDWRQASLAGTIETAAVELFVEFWDRFRAGLAPTQPGVAEAFAAQLAAVLHGEFGLTPFYPANFQDRPGGWVQAADGARMTTGRVREVLRPGLTDRAGELRVPARVVVE